MTYRELLSRLKEATEEQLDQNVTLFDMDEFLPITGVKMTPIDEPADILDPGHLYITTGL